MINLNDVVPQNESVQKVLVVNSGTAENPQTVSVSNIPMQADGSSVYTYVRNGISVQALRPQSSYFNICLDNILLLQSDGTFVPIPLNTVLTNMTNSNLNNALASYKTAYATLVSGVTAATLHYSKMSSTGVVTSETYNLKD